MQISFKAKFVCGPLYARILGPCVIVDQDDAALRHARPEPLQSLPGGLIQIDVQTDQCKPLRQCSRRIRQVCRRIREVFKMSKALRETSLYKHSLFRVRKTGADGFDVCPGKIHPSAVGMLRRFLILRSDIRSVKAFEGIKKKDLSVRKFPVDFL